MRNGRDEELTIKILPDEAKRGTCMNKALEAREFGKIFEYIWVHKRCEQRCHMSASLSSKPLYAFCLLLPPLVCVSCLFCAWFDAVWRSLSTRVEHLSPMQSWSFLWAVLSCVLGAICSQRPVQTKWHLPVSFRIRSSSLNGGSNTFYGSFKPDCQGMFIFVFLPNHCHRWFSKSRTITPPKKILLGLALVQFEVEMKKKNKRKRHLSAPRKHFSTFWGRNIELKLEKLHR